jgi:hypothetical protein
MLMLTGYTYKVSMQLHGNSHFGEAGVNVDITIAFKNTSNGCTQWAEVSHNWIDMWMGYLSFEWLSVSEPSINNVTVIMGIWLV